MMCVMAVRYGVIVNGQSYGLIFPGRGIRQGDPISLYLFLLCVEALSSMLIKANDEDILTGVPTLKRGLRISHLFFADDSLLFCKASMSQWNSLSKILRIYKAASGQKLNNDKTTIFFSRNTQVDIKEAIL